LTYFSYYEKLNHQKQTEREEHEMKNFKQELTSYEHTIISVALDNFLEKQRTAPINEREIENPKLFKIVEKLLKKWDATKTVKIESYDFEGEDEFLDI
tara:strand:+ start:82 stop:375 length:294 start_codon:yes stop_codon:yes gene_type:complete